MDWSSVIETRSRLAAIGAIASALLLAACERPDTSLVAPPATGGPTNGGNWENPRH